MFYGLEGDTLRYSIALFIIFLKFKCGIFLIIKISSRDQRKYNYVDLTYAQERHLIIKTI